MKPSKVKRLIERAKRERDPKLNLSTADLTTFPMDVCRLSHLTELDLGNIDTGGTNRISEIPPEIGALENLRILRLAKNAFQTLPAEIGNLRSLEHLDLWNVPTLRELPPEIGLLQNLEALYIGPSALAHLPAEFGQLARLEFLYLMADSLAALPAEFCRLTQLRHLALSSDALTELPQDMRKLTSLSFLSLQAPLGIPTEILRVTDRPSEVLGYYFRTRRGSRPLNEAKVIVVGRGGAGKTCLLKRMIHGTFNECEPETPGIEIESWDVSLSGGEHVRIHVWDFGGQEILHATHQLFLTERAVYLLVVTGREGAATQDAEYWLQLVGSLGRDSKVIIVLNKSQQHPFDVNRGLLLEKYPQIAGFVRTDCRQATDGSVAPDGTEAMGVEDLRRLLLAQVAGLEHRTTNFPAEWFDIKERMAGMEENFLSWDSYQNICRELGEQDAANQRQLAHFLHILGIALNYQDDPRLRDTHVLNPRWVTRGIYSVLRAGPDAHGEGQGVVNIDFLGVLLSAQDYPRTSHEFLLTLMEKFQLCFQLPGLKGRYLIPELLGEVQPDDITPILAEPGLTFRYQYGVLPEGMLPRFIVQTHAYSRKRPDWRWRTGVVLERSGCYAVVRGDVRERRIDIHVTGNTRNRRELLAIIRDRFEEQHRELKGLSVSERVPVPDDPGVTVGYNFLLQLELEGEDWYRPEGSREKVRVADLLDGIELSQQRAQRRQVNATGTKEQIMAKDHAFLSYCHDNTVEVTQLRNELIAGGEKIWWDKDILGGQDWQQSIRRAMRASYAVILCLSPELEKRITSGVYPEVLDAISAYRTQAPGTVFLIPVMLSACGLPDIEIDGTRTLDRLQAIDLTPGPMRAAGVQRLLESLKAAPFHP